MGLLEDAEHFVGVFCPDRQISVNSRRLFTPASNTKIVTSWFALHTLGEDHRFYSEYSVAEKTLFVRTRGNPLLGHGDIDWLVEEAGLPEKIERVILDTSYLKVEPRPPGWCFDDSGEGYAPLVSDVCFDLNRVTLKKVGRKTSMEPENTYFRVRLSGSAENPRVVGRNALVPLSRLQSARTVSFSYPSPPRFLLEYLAEALRAKGLAGRKLRLGLGRLRGSPTPFAQKTMAEVLRILNKASENVVGELLLLHAGLATGATGLGETLRVLHRRLEERSVTGIKLYDGSGLSRYNLVSPEAIAKILVELWDKKVFVDSLPIGSVDGTLKGRLDSRVKAKTGTLLDVRALSGYADGRVFSIIVNHCVEPDMVVKEIDRFVLEKILG